MGMNMTEQTLERSPYEAVVGPAWASLPTGIRRALTPPWLAEGSFSISRAGKGFAAILAWAIELPPPGGAVPTKFQMGLTPTGAILSRQFGNARSVSTQEIGYGALLETSGLLKLRYEFAVSGTQVAYRQVQAFLFGIALPKALEPQINGLLSPADSDDSWRLSVDISHPWVGKLCSYSGVLRRVS